MMSCSLITVHVSVGSDRQTRRYCLCGPLRGRLYLEQISSPSVNKRWVGSENVLDWRTHKLWRNVVLEPCELHTYCPQAFETSYSSVLIAKFLNTVFCNFSHCVKEEEEEIACVLALKQHKKITYLIQDLSYFIPQICCFLKVLIFLHWCVINFLLFKLLHEKLYKNYLHLNHKWCCFSVLSAWCRIQNGSMWTRWAVYCATLCM